MQELMAPLLSLPEFDSIDILDVNTRSSYGNSMLHIFVVQNDMKRLRCAIAMGAEVNTKGENGYTPLHEAVEQGNLAAIRLLLESGANKDIETDEGLTSLQLAGLLGNNEIIREFHEHPGLEN